MKERRSLRGRVVKDSAMRVGEMMNTKVVTVEPEKAASVAWSRMRQRGIRHLVVAEHDRVRGVISERDLGGVSGASIRKGRLVEDLMTPRVVSVESKTTLSQAADVMRRQQIGSLPVLDDGVLVGIVTASDVFDELGRSSTRSTFPGSIPRGLKRESSRLGVSLVPAHIRVQGTKLSKEKRIDIRQQLGRRLGKFGPSIERVTVRVDDVNGPRGGIDQLCRIKVVLSGLPSVVFEAQDASLDIAIGKALAGTERAVRRTVQRRRMKPIKVGARTRAGTTGPEE
ncbi:CBS domain-containing protein [Nitrospira sp. Nam74]